MTYEYRLEKVDPKRTEEIKAEKDRREAEKRKAYEAEEQEFGNKPTPQQS